MPLLSQGIIKEPLEGLNCFESEWIEEKSWWFRKRFRLDMRSTDASEYPLRFEMLDVGADIFLNGRCLGHHVSAFYPFEMDVKEFLVNQKTTATPSRQSRRRARGSQHELEPEYRPGYAERH
jgi:beta-mannosidase